MNNPLADVFLAVMGGMIFILIVKGGAALIYFLRDIISALWRGEDELVNQAFGKIIKKICDFRLRSLPQRLGLVVLIISILLIVIIAVNTPSYRRYGLGFWSAMTVMACSVFTILGWFSVIRPFIRWLNTGDIAFLREKECKEKIPESVRQEKINVEDADGIFSKTTKFYDVDGVPVTFSLNSLGLHAYTAWDTFPPRDVSYEYVNAGGKLISRSGFDELIEKYLLSRT